MFVILLVMIRFVFDPPKAPVQPAKGTLPQAIISSMPTVDEGIKNTLKSFESEQASGSAVIGSAGSASSKSPSNVGDMPTLDLTGPWQCDHAGVSLSIQDKNIKASFASDKGTQYALVQGDCAYLWSNLKEGTRQCGIGTYLDILAPMLGSADMIGTLTQSMGEKAGKVDAAGLISSCKKTPIKPAVFTLPASIKWAEEKAN
ncbi:MAG: hypothetical protein WCJ70_04030 [bacterium]